MKEECDVFSGDDDDIADIRSHPMKFNLKDNHPVQLNYKSGPKALIQWVQNLNWRPFR